MEKVKFIFLALILCFSCIFTSGCWDSVELDSIFIATTIGIDKGKEKNYNLSIEVAKSARNSSSASPTGSGEGQNKNSIILTTEADTILEGIAKLNFESSRNLFFKHCQLILISTQVAEEGTKDFLDLFLRDPQLRLEIKIFLIEGDMKKFFEFEPQQESSLGNYITQIVNDNARSNDNFQINVLKYVSNLLSEQKSNVLPVIKLEEKQNKKGTIHVSKFALFNDDKIANYLEVIDFFPFNWTEGKVVESFLKVEQETRRANLYIDKIKAKQNIKVTPDKKLKVEFEITMILSVAELINFKTQSMYNLVEILTAQVGKTVEERIKKTFKLTQETSSDIYGFGNQIYKKNPKLWSEIKNDWKEIYKTAEIIVMPIINITNNGYTTISIETEQVRNESR